MGCFNLICGYSGLEIHSDDDVQLHFLVNNEFGDGFLGHMCYPQDSYSLLAPPIKASYNEYGWYEFDETDLMTQMIQRAITNRIDLTNPPTRSYEGSKEYFLANKDLAVEDRELIPWVVVGELIHNGALFVKNKYSEPVQVYLSKFAVHDQLYQDIAKKDLPTCWYQDDAPLVRDVVTERVNKLFFPNPVLIALRAIPTDVITREQAMDLWRLENVIQDRQDDHLDFLSSEFSITKMHLFRNANNEGLTAERIIDAVVGLRAFNAAMDTARRMYLPQGGGHQCYNFDDEIAYLETILAYVKERKDEWDDEDE